MTYSKLLLFDLDGTLLSTDKTVSRANVDALKKCKSLGMCIGYITARSPRKVGTFLEGLPCDCIAYYNGASIYAGNVPLERNEIPYQNGLEAIRKIQAAYPTARIGVYLEPYNYFDGHIYHIVTQESREGTLAELPNYDIQRIRIVFDGTGGIPLEGLLDEDMLSTLTSDGTAIVTHRRASKENALRKLAEWFDVPLCDVIAFGDDVNDLGMIRTAGIGVAMGNAVEALKAAADAVTGTNDEDGVAQWIDRYLLSE